MASISSIIAVPLIQGQELPSYVSPAPPMWHICMGNQNMVVYFHPQGHNAAFLLSLEAAAAAM